MTHLTRDEQEVVINFGAGDKKISIYTSDPVFMRKMDGLVQASPHLYKVIAETEVSKTYEMPRNYLTFRKTEYSEERRRAAAERMKKYNEQRSRANGN